jgi:LysM repeat protein
MSSLRQAGLGILTALFSTALVFGSMLLALVEGGKHVALAPAPTTAPFIATPGPSEPTFTPSPSPSPSETPTESITECKDKPAGWISHEVMSGESLQGLALAFGTSMEALRQANCLTVDTLYPGSLLSVPPPTPSPTSTATSTPPPPTATEEIKAKKQPTRITARCDGHPTSWIPYKVKKGDTLFRIATTYGTTVARLMEENCLTSNIIRVGQVINVPNVPPKRTATPRPPIKEPPPANTEPPPADTEPPAPPKPPAPTEPSPEVSESPVASESPVLTEEVVVTEEIVVTVPPINP